ncbi:MAG: hypothetical protein AAFU79_35015 [Myxococcota bacterium]
MSDGRTDDDELPTVVDVGAGGALSALRAELGPPEAPPPVAPSVQREARGQRPSRPPKRPKPKTPPPRRPLPPALDLSTALGVDPTPAPETSPRGSGSEPAFEDAEVDLAALLAAQRHPPRSRPTRPAPPRPRVRDRGPGSLHRLATSSRALSKSLPVILSAILLACAAVAFMKIFTGRRSTPHVRLEVLALPGQTLPRPTPDASTRIFLDTVPEGIVVFYGQRILGKTPCEADLPLALPPQAGFRLHGPRFEEWVAEVDASPAGEFLVHAELNAR